VILREADFLRAISGRTRPSRESWYLRKSQCPYEETGSGGVVEKQADEGDSFRSHSHSGTSYGALATVMGKDIGEPSLKWIVD
jgi:hypothetical protein